MDPWIQGVRGMRHLRVAETCVHDHVSNRQQVGKLLRAKGAQLGALRQPRRGGRGGRRLKQEIFMLIFKLTSWLCRQLNLQV